MLSSGLLEEDPESSRTIFLYQSHKMPKWIRYLWTMISQRLNNPAAFGSGQGGELHRLLQPLLKRTLWKAHQGT